MPPSLAPSARVRVRRTGKRTLADLCEQFAWVFSWTQNRHYLTGWYSFGSLAKALDEAGKAQLKEIFGQWNFLRNMVRQVQNKLGLGRS